jgi:protein SCO1/2
MTVALRHSLTAGLVLFTLASMPLWGMSRHARAEEEPYPEFRLRTYENRGGDFSLTNSQGGRTALSDYRGKVVLMTFGYTHCPDICPATLVLLKQTLQELGSRAAAVQVVFVTVDPERDTAARLKEYIPLFDDGFVGLTGTESEIRTVASQYKVKYEYRESGTAAGRLVDHTAFIYLIDPRGQLRYLYPHTSPPDFIAKGVRLVFNEGSAR